MQSLATWTSLRDHMEAGFPQSYLSKRERKHLRSKTQIIYNLILKVRYHFFCYISIVRSKSNPHSGNRIIQNHEYKGTGIIIEDPLMVCPPHSAICPQLFMLLCHVKYTDPLSRMPTFLPHYCTSSKSIKSCKSRCN